MENLEKQCLEKLDKILSKFDLKINIVYVTSLNVCQYRLIDNSLNPYSDWLGLWLTISDILMHRNSIFECLQSYYISLNNSRFLTNETHLSSIFQRYSEVYQFIQPLKSCCLEEFIFKCDLMGI